MAFIERGFEESELDKHYKKKASNLIVIYGRRRVGKSSLVEHFMRDKLGIQIEGLENVQTKVQIQHVLDILTQQLAEPLLRKMKTEQWIDIFDYLTQYFKQQSKKTILFLDEFQWLASNQTKLVSLIKYYWDKHWQKLNVMLILCGSVSSYMIKRVIKSKALYGRINYELCLQPFNPVEISKLLGHKRSKDEICLYSLILGGIPKYLNEINLNQSFDQNINRLFFLKNALFSNEYERVFYSQFKEYKIYAQIATALKAKPLSLAELAKIIKIASGGGLKSYLENLEQSNFISRYIPYHKDLKSKLIKYKLTDEYLRFYYKFVEPNLRLIQNNLRQNLFTNRIKPEWKSWLGYAFENFCLKQAFYLAEVMGFADQVKQWGPLFERQDPRFQIDLVYWRFDKVIVVCEIKFHETPVSVNVIKEVEKKCQLIHLPRGYTLEKALISRFGADENLKNLEYFTYDITVNDIFK